MQTTDNGQAKRPGRSKDTPQVRRRIARAILAGATYEAAAACGGISERTFRYWMDKKAGFRRFIEDANGRAQLRLVVEITDSKDWRAKAWMLERRFGWLAARGTSDFPEAKDKLAAKPKPNNERIRQRLLDLLDETPNKPTKDPKAAAKRTRGRKRQS